jgi:hypothetical protein
MSRSLLLAIALALAAPLLLLPAPLRASDRTLPMQFELRAQGPADACGTNCMIFISAAGAITADTPHHFLLFAQSHDLAGATFVIDSDGGSVLGAIALGRQIRKLKLATTVGRLVDVPAEGKGEPRAVLSPNADCESMCAFVLLGGVQRSVPTNARVMVHQQITQLKISCWFSETSGASHNTRPKWGLRSICSIWRSAYRLGNQCMR